MLLITAHVAMDGSLLDAAAGAPAAGDRRRGDRRRATRRAPLLDAAMRAMEQGIVVAFTTRCPAGAAGDGYAFPGGGATWVRAGALLAGHLSGPKARIALALGLGAGLDRDALADAPCRPARLGPRDRARRRGHRRRRSARTLA